MTLPHHLTRQAEPTGLDSGSELPASLLVVGFRVGDLACAFRVDAIREVIVPERMTKIPQVPAYVEGIYNLRGTMIPIINLHALLGLAAPSSNEPLRTLVVMVEARTIGCQVDAVTRMMSIPLSHIQPAANTTTAKARHYIDGFVHREGQVLVLLDADELLHPDKLEDIHRHAMAEAAMGGQTF